MYTAHPIPPLADLDNPALRAALQQRIDRKTAPHGALAGLADLALRIGLILGTEQPRLQAPQLLVFAADHGITAQGVSAYPADVTWQMVGNFLAGGAAVSVLARQHGIAQTVVDCGVARELPPAPGLLMHKIAPGTQDSSQGPAMSAAQCQQALQNGARIVASLPGNALLLGEMGIGNTSAASLLTARLGGLDIAQVTGAGTGLDDAGVARKTEVLRRALHANSQAHTPLDVLAALGGFEIATMVGAVLQAASQRRVIVVDGFIASAAVLAAQHLVPGGQHLHQRCIFAHQSGERGHTQLLQLLRAKPLLNLGLRLGEGSGAALAWPLLQSACAILNEMASFESAGVSDKA